MKKNILLIISITIGVLFLNSCKRDLTIIAPYQLADPSNTSFVKIIDASPSFRQVFKGSDSFNVYVNGLKVNGTFLTYNSLFPSATNLYAAVPSGPQSIRITVNGKVTPDSITLASLNKTLDAGAYYSFIITDEALNSNEARQMWIKDNFALTDTAHFSLRLVDAVLNDATPVDVFSTVSNANIFSNVSPGTATAFISLPFTTTADVLSIRIAGTQTEITKLTGVTYTRSRAYTLLYKGLSGGGGTKARAAIIYNNN